MSILLAIISVILYIFALVSISLRIGKPAFTPEESSIIRKQRNRTGISGGVCIILSIINACCWNKLLLQISDGWMIVLAIASVISFFAMLLDWLGAPTEESVAKARQHKAKLSELESFLSRYHPDKGFVIDEKNGLNVAVCQKYQKLLIYQKPTIFNSESFHEAISFSSIVDCEVLEDNETVLKGGLGRAAIGALIAGETGAIVGATTRSSSSMVNSMCIRIITNDILNPYHPIQIINTPTERKSNDYKEKYRIAQEVYATAIAIVHNSRN